MADQPPATYPGPTSAPVAASGRGPSRQTRTRRQLYLAAHPGYFGQAAHGLALPVAYDRLVRAYQTPAERQAEGRQQGWARMLEGALLRGEAKRDAALRSYYDRRAQQSSRGRVSRESGRQTNGGVNGDGGGGSASGAARGKGLKPLPEEMDGLEEEGENGEADGDDDCGSLRLDGLGNGLDESSDPQDPADSKWDLPLGLVPVDELLESSPEAPSGGDQMRVDEPPALMPTTGPQAVIDSLDKEHALARWRELLSVRFVAGADEDFDYASLDADESLDDGQWVEAQQQEEWFDDEPESWTDSGSDKGKKLEGETGIQDF